MLNGNIFYIQTNIGASRYVVNYYNGVKKHSDGSPFFDIAILKSKDKLNKFVNTLIANGYKEKS
jgi:hypothetical protein